MDSEFWQDADYRVQRAKDLLRRRQLPEALEELRAAAELDPFNAVHHYELGRCLTLLGRDDEAADAFGRAAETDPREPAYWSAYGERLLQLARWREAVGVFEEVSKLLPDDEPALANRVWAYTELGDHERAEQMFYLAQQVRDDGPEAFYHVGRSLDARGEHAKAAWCWQRVIALNDGRLATAAHVRTAESLVRQDRLEEARRHYLQALARDGRFADALLGMADVLLRLRRYDAAGERIRRAVRLDPDDPRGHFLAGRRYFEQGKLNEAHVALRRVIELDAAFPRAHLLLAKLAARQDDPAGVCSHCHAEMMRRPDRPQTLRELGDLLLDVGDLEHAAACFKRLVAISPDDSRGWQNLGVAECWRGELMAGVVASRRAIKLDPLNLPAHNNLALAFLEMNELDAAARVIGDGLAIDPRDTPLRRLRLRLRLRRLRLRLRLRRGWSHVRTTFRRLFRRDDE